VTASSANTFALALEPVWERVQQRAFVRISAHNLQVRIVRSSVGGESGAAEGDSPGDAMHQLVDISAGGIRFESNDDYEAGEDVVCHFELPGSLCFVLRARIVRSPEHLRAASSKPSVAVEFVGLDETHRSQLLRWVYREQVRRHRIRDREQEKAEKLAEKRRVSRRQVAARIVAGPPGDRAQPPSTSEAKRSRTRLRSGVSTAAAIIWSGSKPSAASTARRAST